MRIVPTDLPGALILEPQVFRDDRGYFLETYARDRFAEAGIAVEFVQDNHSHSRAGVLRGLHYQLGAGQAKLIQVLRGRALDVAVDLLPGSPTFGRWIKVELSGESKQMLLLPPHCAHGFYVLEEADILYKCSDRYRPELERGINWQDPELAISWPTRAPVLSERDRRLPELSAVRPEDLPCDPRRAETPRAR